MYKISLVAIHLSVAPGLAAGCATAGRDGNGNGSGGASSAPEACGTYGLHDGPCGVKDLIYLFY